MIFINSEIVYINVIEDWLNGPRLLTFKGRLIWIGKRFTSIRKTFSHLSEQQQWYSPTGRSVGFSSPKLLIKTHLFKAFVVGAAIPQIQTIVGLIASVAILQFTYTFPPILRFGYDVITDAMAADAPYVPGQGARGRVDTWRQWSRWKRVGSLFFLKIICSSFYLLRACSAVAGTSNFSI